MGKQNVPLILGFVNNSARNSFSVTEKQVHNTQQQKAVKQQKTQQSWSVVNNKKANTKGFQSWAEVANRNTKSELKQTSWTNVVKQQSKTQQQRNKIVQQQPKQVQKQQPQKSKPQQQRKSQQSEVQTWGWYPASKQAEELKKWNQQKANKQVNKKQQGKQQAKQPVRKLSKQQKLRKAQMMQMKANREAQERRRSQEQRNNLVLLKNINTVYDGFSYTFPLQNGRNAWIASSKVGGNKVLSVATLFAIKNAPTVRGNKKAFVQRDGKIIFNNKCIRRAVEGKYTGHKKFRGNRVLTCIPEKWLTQENSYAKGANYEKFANINGPKRNERCYSFKGVY